MKSWRKIIWKSLSYILVAAVASAITLALWGGKTTKLTELEQVLNRYFIGEVDSGAMEDAAAEAMVDSLGDRWSYYIPAEEYGDYQENKNNAYVGVGITVRAREDGTGLDVLEVTPGNSAQEAGVLPGDILIRVQEQSVAGMDVDEVKNMIRGEKGTKVDITVLRSGAEMTFTLERREIKVQVATGTLLPNNIGLVRINNFNTNCAEEAIAAIESLRAQGADKLIFDVRNNPGGYVQEMLKVLDYLLPEGVLFRDVDYRGKESQDTSDAACLEIPMVVLMNEDSYSAAEFFPAVLQEYEWATLVGTHTTGKGHYQRSYRLSDGSAVNLSVGKYFTPSGKNLTEVGGLTPDVEVEVDEETASKIYAQSLAPEDDPQIQAAVEILQKNPG